MLVEKLLELAQEAADAEDFYVACILNILVGSIVSGDPEQLKIVAEKCCEAAEIYTERLS